MKLRKYELDLFEAIGVGSEKKLNDFFHSKCRANPTKNDNTNFLSDKYGSTNVVLHNCACMKKINGHEMTEVE